MVRIGVVVYLVLATAAGPAVCCCTMNRLFAFSSQGWSTTSSHHGCCNRHGKDGRRPGEVPKRRPDCPCQDSPRDSAYLAAAKSLVPEDAARSLNLPGAAGMVGSALPHSLAPGAIIQVPRESIAFPFHDARQVLRALHILRC